MDKAPPLICNETPVILMQFVGLRSPTNLCEHNINCNAILIFFSICLLYRLNPIQCRTTFCISFLWDLNPPLSRSDVGHVEFGFYNML